MTSLPYENGVPRRTIEELLTQGQWVRAFCRRLVGPAHADDLEQETWLAALRQPPRERGAGNSPRSWLAAVARNLAHDGLRRRARRSRREQLVARPEAQEAAADLLTRTELAHLVTGEMLALREPFRTTLVMRFVDCLPGSEIAARMAVSETTVRTRISRGLDEIRARLDARHGGDRQRWLAALVPLAIPARRLGIGVTLSASILLVGLSLTAVFWKRAARPSLVAGPGPVQEQAGESKSEAALVALSQESRASQRRAVEARPIVPASGALVAPRVAWHHRSSQQGAPLVLGDRVIAIGKGIACLDARDGSVLWEHSAPDRAFWIGPPVPAGELLIAVHATGGVAAFALDDGQLVWSRAFEELGTTEQPGRLVSNPEGALYVAPTNDGLVALRARDGSEVWRTSLGARVQLTPAVANGLVLAGTEAGTFAALRAEDGSLAWRVAGGAKYGWTNPVVADGIVYVGDRGLGGGARREDAGKLVSQVLGKRAGALQAFRVENGEHLWGRIFGATGLSEPYVDGELLWIGFGTVCLPLSRENGELQRARAVRTGSNPFGTPRVLGDQLVFGNLDGHLYAHDAASGKLLWAFSLAGEPQVSGWTAAHGRLYVATGAGIVALEETPGAEPLEAGARIVFEAPEPKVADAPSEALAAETAKPVFANAHELSARWLRVLNPSSISETEAKWFEDEAPVVDDALRQATWDALAAAIAGEDATLRSAALRTIARCAKVAGVGQMREPVLAIARQGTAAQRFDALRALMGTGIQAQDLELLLADWETAATSQRLQMTYMLRCFNTGRFEGRTAELVLDLLDGIDPASFNQMASGLWGASLSDELAARVCELAIQPESRSMRTDAIYYVLSTLADKQPQVIDVLLDAARDVDPELAERALWGLGQGVVQAQRARVVEELLGLAPTLDAPRRQTLGSVVERYGTPEQIARLPR